MLVVVDGGTRRGTMDESTNEVGIGVDKLHDGIWIVGASRGRSPQGDCS